MEVSDCLRKPLSQLGLVGELFHPGHLPDQRFVIEPFGVSQAGSARAEAIKQLSHQQFGAVAVRSTPARVQTRQGPDFSPQTKLLG
jgi:hypothetical protein